MSVQIDIAELLVMKAIQHLAEADRIQKSTKDELKEAEECMQTVILFQVSMEAIINEEIERSPLLKEVKRENVKLSAKFKSLSFKNKWERAFDSLNIKSKKDLRDYFTFYSKYRILISHPRSRYVSLENYKYEKVYVGIRNGWNAMQQLYSALGKTKILWEDMCKQVSLVDPL